ncbi:MAG: sigma 54-interacting transcriptional regulator [Thermoanaerobaculia bacterium]|nr:sigma 54-interacting transcriptional regulator [Thermoanaerobaculia bacterium]
MTAFGAVQLTDREKLELLLAGATALEQLTGAGRHLANGWGGLDSAGRLCGLTSRAGKDPRLVQERLAELVGVLFGDLSRGGRGDARAAARRLSTLWEQRLAPLSASQAVAQVRAELAPLNAATAGSPFEAALGLWRRGRAQATLDALEDTADPRAVALRLKARMQLGELRGVRRELKELAGGRSLTRLPTETVLELGEVALRAFGTRNDEEDVAAWLAVTRRATKAADGDARARHLLLEAVAAWDRRNLDVLDRLLAEVAPQAEAPTASAALRWRWHQTRALAAMSRADGAGMIGELARALAVDRRALARSEAAGLWNDLGIGRARAGDLAGAERAFLHTQRLYAGCDGNRQTTLALANLAEIRIRRGRLSGVAEILTQSLESNRLSDNRRGQVQDLGLWARYELALGRARAALAPIAEAREILERSRLDWYREELALFAARAHGWLGDSAAARSELEAVPPEAYAELEGEEIPAVLALAGETAAARAAAEGAGPARELWLELLAGDEIPAARWEDLAQLEPFRAARVVADAELFRPSVAPAPWRRRAAAALRRTGALALAERLEQRDHGPWQALADYAREPAGNPAALRRLFQQAGHPEARLEVHDARLGERTVILGGVGGPARQRTTIGDLEWRLDAAFASETLTALFAVAIRDSPPPNASAEHARPSPDGLIGDHPAFRGALDRARRLARGDMPVLVLGESGTGKELVAREVHRHSDRARRTFVALNCAAVAENLLLSDLFGHVRGAFTGADRDREGVFETAAGGTVFLDEIGDLPLAAQGMLLRVLQEGEIRRVGESLPRKVDARVVAATHRDLAAMVAARTFREDLFYRLKVARVELPPLRDRGGDVLALAEFFVTRFGGSRLTPGTRARLLAHPWPGNVRELENVLRVAVTLAGDDAIEPEHLDLPEPTGVRTESSFHAQVDAFRQRLLSEALAAAGGNQAEAARRLGLTRQALSYLVRQERREGRGGRSGPEGL